MTKINFNNLELQIKALLRHLARFKQENFYLLEKQSNLIRERNELLIKNDMANKKIADLIERLKYVGEWHE